MRKETFWCDSCGSVLDDENPRAQLTINEALGRRHHFDLCHDCKNRLLTTYFPERSESDERPQVQPE